MIMYDNLTLDNTKRAMESALKTAAGRAHTAGVVANKLAKRLLDKPPAFEEDASYDIKMTELDTYEKRRMMQQKTDDERLEGDLADESMYGLFTSEQFTPTLDKLRKDKSQALEAQMSWKEQSETIEEQRSPRPSSQEYEEPELQQGNGDNGVENSGIILST